MFTDEQDRPVVVGLGLLRSRSTTHESNMALVPRPQDLSIVQSMTPQPDAPIISTRKYTWSRFDDAFVDHAVSRMVYVSSLGGNLYNIVTPTKCITDRFFGMDDVALTLCSKLLKPRLYAPVYQAHLTETTRGIHFAIVGPEGSGKRSVVYLAASEWNFHIMTISPDTFEPNYLWVACEMATIYKPTILYFDGFDKLLTNPEFVREFNTRIMSDVAFTTIKNWNNVWLVFGLTEINSDCLNILTRLCFHDDYSCIAAPSAAQLFGLAQIVFSRAQISSPSLSAEEEETFRGTLLNATPRMVTDFALSVINSAHKYASFEQFNVDNNRFTKSASLVFMDNTGRTLMAPPLQPPPTAYSVPIPEQASLASFECTQPMTRETALGHVTQIQSNIQPAPTNLPSNLGILINWKRDAERLYNTTCLGGVDVYTLPRTGSTTNYYNSAKLKHEFQKHAGSQEQM